MVGVRGFEPPASATRTLRATGLRYTPPTKESTMEAVVAAIHLGSVGVIASVRVPV